jgi:hypothetical protein
VLAQGGFPWVPPRRWPPLRISIAAAAGTEYRDHRLEWMIRFCGVGFAIAGLEDDNEDDNIRCSWPGV